MNMQMSSLVSLTLDPLFFTSLTHLSSRSSTVDQPVGTGYSYVATNAYVHELPEVSGLGISGNLDSCES